MSYPVSRQENLVIMHQLGAGYHSVHVKNATSMLKENFVCSTNNRYKANGEKVQFPVSVILNNSNTPFFYTVMPSRGTFSDEPLSPAGRLFIDPKTDVVIHCIAISKNPIDLDVAKTALKSSVLVQHPRFCSLLVRDENGFEHWRRTELDIDRHFIVINNRLNKPGKFVGEHETQGFDDDEGDGDGDGEAAVNQYVADLSVSSPLSMDKPLWELHLLKAHKCVVFRIHHALGDGFSLMSMLMAGSGKVDVPAAVPPIKTEGTKSGKRRDWFWLLSLLWG
ncbi:hypothetical protein Goari_024660, partial [Gossypium aridum]|nr:hypothetical protein [Gossypium aridum]